MYRGILPERVNVAVMGLGATLRTRGLFSKHLTVATCPLKRRLPP